MSDNIIPFQPPDKPNDIVLICPECSCSTWHLTAVPTLECANCLTVVNPSPMFGDWRRVVPMIPPVPHSQLPDNVGTNTIYALGNQELAQSRVFKKIKGWKDDDTLHIVTGLREDGEITTWCAAKTSTARDWIVGKLYRVIEMLQKTEFHDDKHTD